MINRRTITILLTIANLGLLVTYVSGWVKPFASDKKTIIRRLTLSKEPVEITFKLKGQPVNGSKATRAAEGIRTEEFDGDQEWLKDLTLKLRNTSDKTITYIVLNLHFPEVTKNGLTALHQIFLGVDPDGKFQRAELQLEPNKTIEISLAERYDGLKTLAGAGNSRIENVGKIRVDFNSAYFEDGTLYEAGTLFKRNPNQNQLPEWVKIDNP